MSNFLQNRRFSIQVYAEQSILTFAVLAAIKQQIRVTIVCRENFRGGFAVFTAFGANFIVRNMASN